MKFLAAPSTEKVHLFTDISDFCKDKNEEIPVAKVDFSLLNSSHYLRLDGKPIFTR